MSYIKYCAYCGLALRADNHGDLCFSCSPSPAEQERKRADAVLEVDDARRAWETADVARDAKALDAAWARWDKARVALRKYER